MVTRRPASPVVSASRSCACSCFASRRANYSAIHGPVNRAAAPRNLPPTVAFYSANVRFGTVSGRFILPYTGSSLRS
jgi:hypothetical protein